MRKNIQKDYVCIILYDICTNILLYSYVIIIFIIIFNLKNLTLLFLLFSRNSALGHAEYFANPSCLFGRNFLLSLSFLLYLPISFLLTA